MLSPSLEASIGLDGSPEFMGCDSAAILGSGRRVAHGNTDCWRKRRPGRDVDGWHVSLSTASSRDDLRSNVARDMRVVYPPAVQAASRSSLATLKRLNTFAPL